MTLKIIGMLSVYNDSDIIKELIEYYISQGLNLVIVDNDSTDNTVEICNEFVGSGVNKIISFPSKLWDLYNSQKIQYDLALLQNPDWVIKIDSDEFFESGKNNFSLKEVIVEVNNLGYNLIQFDWFNFFLTDNDNYSGKSVKERLPYYSWASDFLYRAWKVVPGNGRCFCSIFHLLSL